MYIGGKNITVIKNDLHCKLLSVVINYRMFNMINTKGVANEPTLPTIPKQSSSSF